MIKSSIGGRRAGIKAVVIEYTNGKKVSYRATDANITTDIDKKKVVSTGGLSLSEIAKRARDAGYEVTAYSLKQLREYDEEHRKKNKQ